MSENLVDIIREKTEETDFDCILKSSIGGYTKRSVLEYVGGMKQQQQTMKETYDSEIRQLRSEKDALIAERDALLSDRNALRAELETLRQQPLEAEQPDQTQEVPPVPAPASGISPEDVAQLQREQAALEQDMDEAIARIKEDEEKLNRYEAALNAEKQKAEKAAGDAQSYRIMLDTVRRQNEEQERLLSQQTIELARLKEDLSSLQRQVSEEEVAELNQQVEELMSSVSLLHNEVALRDGELENRAARLKALTLQEQKNHALLDRFRTLLDRSQEQNESLESENNGLGRRLEQQMTESIELHREISRLQAANGILQRRLTALQFKHLENEETVQGGADIEAEESPKG